MVVRVRVRVRVRAVVRWLNLKQNNLFYACFYSVVRVSEYGFVSTLSDAGREGGGAVAAQILIF